MKKYFTSYWIRSAFFVFLQRFSLTLFGLINYMLLSRTLTKDQLGIWALFLVITGIFEIAKGNLLKNAHIKYVSASNDPHERTIIASSSFLINITISGLFILIIAFFADWISHSLNSGHELADMLRWFIPGLFIMIFFSHLEATQQSHLDFKGVFAGYFVRQTFFFIVILVYKLTNKPISLNALAVYQSISIAIGTIILYIFSRKYFLHKFKASKAWVKKITGYGGYILSSGTVANLYSNLDQIMAARFLSLTQVAYYNVATRINGLIDMPSYAAAEIIFPQASRASIEEGKDRVRYMFEKMVSILIAFTVPAAIFIIIFPKFVTIIIAGKGYSIAASILQLYMITGIFRPVQNQAANLLNSIGKPKTVFIINTITTVILMGINYVCLLQWGFIGIAIGSLITAIIGFIIWYFVMKKEIDLSMVRVVKYSLEFYKMMYTKAISFLGKSKKSDVVV